MRDLSAEASPPSPRAMAAGGEGGCVTREERSTTEAQRARRNTENSTPNALVPMLRGLPDGASRRRVGTVLLDAPASPLFTPGTRHPAPGTTGPRCPDHRFRPLPTACLRSELKYAIG